MKQITNKTVLKQEIGQENCKEYGCGNIECTFKCLKPKKIFKTYQPLKIDSIIYWVDKETKITNKFSHVFNPHYNQIWTLDKNQISIAQAEGDRLEFNGGGIIAQSQPKLEGIPTIEIEPVGFDEFEYTQKDISNFYPQ
jgi:hypothetical protein